MSYLVPTEAEWTAKGVMLAGQAAGDYTTITAPSTAGYGLVTNPSTATGMDWQLGAAPVIKYKTADQSVSSTTLADDTHLTFTIGTTGTYVFDGYLWTFAAATATGAKIAINGPTASTINFGAIGALTQGSAGAASTFWGNSTNAYNAATSLGATNVGTTTATAGMINFAGHIVATATGTLVLRIAGEAAASITYKLGSWMRVTRVA